MDEWKEGWPPQQGWYDCLVDGELERLRHWVCSMSGRHEWIDVDGTYIRGIEVKWCGEPSARYI